MIKTLKNFEGLLPPALKLNTSLNFCISSTLPSLHIYPPLNPASHSFSTVIWAVCNNVVISLNTLHPTATVAVSWSTAFHSIIAQIHLSSRGFITIIGEFPRMTILKLTKEPDCLKICELFEPKVPMDVETVFHKNVKKSFPLSIVPNCAWFSDHNICVA